MAKAERFVPSTSGSGNEPTTERLSLNQTAAALVAMLNGAQQVRLSGNCGPWSVAACAPGATQPRGAATMVDRLTAAEAATQIIGLINSRPATPWPHEIEALIARVAPMPDATSTLPDHVVAYHDRAREFLGQCKVVGPMHSTAPNYEAEYERSSELSDQVDKVAHFILDTPAETWGDMIGLASIVAHEAGHDLDALGPRRTNDGDPGPKAAEMLALAVLRLHAAAVPQIVPVDVELVRLISAWREQRDIIDQTAVETAGILTDAESKPSEEITGKAIDAACDLAKQIWERARAETWSGGPVNPLTLAVLAEILLHHELGASNTLVDTGEYYMDQKATAELMVAVMSFARSAGVLSDLLPMEGRFLPPALLKGGCDHE
jgi:hypothetical protein